MIPTWRIKDSPIIPEPAPVPYPGGIPGWTDLMLRVFIPAEGTKRCTRRRCYRHIDGDIPKLEVRYRDINSFCWCARR